jgi:sulfite reductase (NADPH) hemoprotein beta-component
MYQYDQYDQAMVDARVAEFRDQVPAAWPAN